MTTPTMSPVTNGTAERSGPRLATLASIAGILSLVVAVAAWLWPKSPSSEPGGPTTTTPVASHAAPAVNLSGTWVGQLTGFTDPLQYRMTLTQKANQVSGTARGDGVNPLDGSPIYAVFKLSGHFDQPTFTFTQQSVVESDPPGAQNWCLISGTLTYSASGALSGGWHALPSSNPNCSAQSGQLRLQRG